ncbi:MAG: prolyl-tRNA synthetase associated domain-containing protein [Nitratireductor sp.]
MENKLPTPPEKLFSILDELEIKTTTHEHEAVFSVEESDKVTARIEGGHTKNLFLKDKKDDYYLLIVGHHSKLKLNHMHKRIGAHKRVSFGSPEMLMELLGITPGSVNAFTPINDKEGRVKVFIDLPLMNNTHINAHPMTNTMTTTIAKEELLRFLEYAKHTPQIMQLSESEEEQNA